MTTGSALTIGDDSKLKNTPSVLRARHTVMNPWDKIQEGLPEGGNLAKVIYKLQSEMKAKKNANLGGQFINLIIKGVENALTEGDIEVLCKALIKFDSVESLCLSHQNAPIDANWLNKYIRSSRALRTLDLSYSEISDLKPVLDALSPTSNCENTSEKGEGAGALQYLNIGGIPMNYETMTTLVEKLKHNKSLEAIKMNGCDLKIDSIIKLLSEGLPVNTTVQALDISRSDRINNPYNLSVHLQRYFANNTHTISRLVLNQLSLDDQCMRNIMLGVLRSENNLKHLDVAANKFSRDAAKSVVELLNKSKIQSINLSYNRLEDPGASEILASLTTNKALKTLIIKSCEASEPTWLQAKETFETNKTLQEFFVWGNNFEGQSGAQALSTMIGRRFTNGLSIDLEPYKVDGVIYMAEDGEHALAAARRFNWNGE